MSCSTPPKKKNRTKKVCTDCKDINCNFLVCTTEVKKPLLFPFLNKTVQWNGRKVVAAKATIRIYLVVWTIFRLRKVYQIWFGLYVILVLLIPRQWSCSIMSHLLTSCSIMSHLLTFCSIMFHLVTSCSIMSHLVTTCSVISYLVTSCNSVRYVKHLAPITHFHRM